MTSRETGFEPTNDRIFTLPERHRAVCRDHPGSSSTQGVGALGQLHRVSDSPSDFDRAAAFAEGYAQALVDGEQIEISTERDLLIISIVDEWRRNFIRTIGSSTFSTPLLQGHS